MCQKQLILKHLRRVGSISPLEARHVYGIERLASRVDELRQEGYAISTAMKRDAMGKRYAEYRLNGRKPVSVEYLGGGKFKVNGGAVAPKHYAPAHIHA